MPATRLVDEVDFKNREERIDFQFIDSTITEEKPDAVELMNVETSGEPTIILDTNKDKGDVLEAKARRFLDLVKKGDKPHEAARKVGVSMAEIRRTRLKSKIKNLVSTYHMPDEVRKLLVKAGLNRLYVANIGKKDIANQKILLDTIKQMAADPDVGLQANQQIGVQINLGELGELLKNASPEVVIKDE